MRKLLTSLLCVVMVVCMMPNMAWAAATDSDTASSQTASDWSANPDTSWYNSNDVKTEYTLTTAEQLAGFFSLMKERRTGTDFKGSTIKLGNDIVLNDVTGDDWTESAIKWDGKAARDATVFAGTFDGCGHSIIGLYSETGLFAKLNGTVQNLTIDTAVVSGKNVFYVGAIVGEANTNSKISGCTVKNSVIAEGEAKAAGGVVGSGGRKASVEGCTVTNCEISGSSTVGGICGTSGVISGCTVEADCSISDGTWIGGIVGSMGESVTNCKNNATVSGTSSVGGIVGVYSGGTSPRISGCTNTGTVNASKTSAGGIIGGTTSQILTISDCTNSGAVAADEGCVGGIAGKLFVEVSITNCISEGSVTGTSNVGGIVGYSDLSTGQPHVAGNPNSITNCTISAEIKGETNVGGIVGTNDVVDYEGKEATTIANNILTPAASVSGTTNVGALIGDNQTETDTGTVKNNFWPEAAGAASGSGAGSSSDEDTNSTIKTTNSSYGADGTLNVSVKDEENNSVDTIQGVVETIFGDSDQAPDALKVKVTFADGGHGTAVPEAQNVVIGSEITLGSMDNDGYWTFRGWKMEDSDTIYESGTVYKAMTDTTFTAQWRDDTPNTPYIPSTPTVQKPVIEADANATVTLDSTGTIATITVADGYELADVTVNGVSKGAVTTLIGLKTGDKIVIKTQKVETPDDNASLIDAVKNTKLVARSAMAKAKGKTAVKVYWYAADGSDLEFDGYEVYRSLKRYSGFGKTPFFKTANEKYYNTAIKKGSKYYYKVRAYKVINGEKVYTNWSTKAWRTVK